MPLTYDNLFAPFSASMKPRDRWRVGVEAEKFGVNTTTGAPVLYDGAHGIVAVLLGLERQHQWAPVREHEGGPVIALERGEASITLEPGGQLELSGRPCGDLHQVVAEMVEHLAEIATLCATLQTSWLGVGFHPFARQEDLPWVPKLRYGIMREYLPTRGARALDMMRRTATVQANFDYADEADAMRKVRAGLKLSVIVTAMIANSPLHEGHLTRERSLRAAVWLDVDPDRQGLLPQMWRPEARLSDYIDWALDAPMFLFKRAGKVIANTGQTFRSFLEDGFHGERATADDWNTHLKTLFPEVRLKQTLEVRGADSVPTRYAVALPALYTGIFYDEAALAQVEELLSPVMYEDAERLRPAVAAQALGARLRGRSLREWAERVLDIACGGLSRRARLGPAGKDETVYLEPLSRLVGAGMCPADELVQGLPGDPVELRHEVIARTRLSAEDGKVFGIDPGDSTRPPC